MDVVIGYYRSRREARQTVRDLRRMGARADAIGADLRDPRHARRLIATAVTRLGGLDVLVNNAALFSRTPFATTTVSQYDSLMDLNAKAAFFCAQEAARAMRRSGGHIVNIGDVGAGLAWPGYVPYTMSKAAIATLTRGLAAALAPRGIAVNCVAPAAVMRPPGFSAKRWRRLRRKWPVTVDDVTAAVRFFATCAPDVTGRVLIVDGRRRRADGVSAKRAGRAPSRAGSRRAR